MAEKCRQPCSKSYETERLPRRGRLREAAGCRLPSDQGEQGMEGVHGNALPSPVRPDHRPLFARRPSFAWRVCCPRFGARESALKQIAPDRLDPSRATRLVQYRVVDKKPSVALMRYESEPNPALDAAKPALKSAFGAQLRPDTQSSPPAVAHPSHFWPRAPQIARKRHISHATTHVKRHRKTLPQPIAPA